MSRRLSGKVSGKGYDEMYHLVEKCKEDNDGKEPFLRRVVLAPEPMCVLASDNQLEDMTKILTDAANPVVMLLEREWEKSRDAWTCSTPCAADCAVLQLPWTGYNILIPRLEKRAMDRNRPRECKLHRSEEFNARR